METDGLSPLAAAWEGLCDAVAAASRDRATALEPFVAAVADVNPKAEALARRRRPFVCHRHGEQRGGFCRTCSRGR